MKISGRNKPSGFNKFSYLLILPFFFGFWSSNDNKKETTKKEVKQETVTQMKNVREV